MQGFPSGLREVAASPLALIGYLAVVAAWVVVALKVKKAKLLLNSIRHLSEQNRLEAMRLEYHGTLKSSLSAQEWLQSKKLTLLFTGLIATLLVVVLITAFTLFRNQPFGPSTIEQNTRGGPPVVAKGDVVLEDGGATRKKDGKQ